MVAAGVFFVLNVGDGRSAARLCARVRQSARSSLANIKETASVNLAMGPLGWLMAVVYGIQWWTTLLFALPLYTTRTASQRFVEMREMFTQTIGALAEAVDKRDPYTARHSQRVKEIAVDIGRRHARQRRRSSRLWSGAACSTTSARSASRTRSC